jgi:starch synthase
MRKLEKTGPKKFNILIIASEMEPYAKAGGLADVASSLAHALKDRGHDVRVVIPKYRQIDTSRLALNEAVQPMGVWMGNTEEWCAAYMSIDSCGVPVYFIDHSLYFQREGLYHNHLMHDYDDNPVRFGFFSRASLQLCKDIGFKPDIVHVNDWQSALATAYLKIWHWNDTTLGTAASVLTIHNIAYQGIYSKHHMDYLGLGWHNFTEEKMETFDRINLLKAGIYYADMITTVSPTFAKDIISPHGGFGLAPYLSNRSQHLFGIVNGIDTNIWNPQADELIPHNYSSSNLRGKSLCKKALQKLFHLNVDHSIPVIGIIGRFVEQKGFHILAQSICGILDTMNVQFAILGSGEHDLQNFFIDLPSRYRGKAGSFIGFDNERAHLIEAGADFFLMPSIFEPCGLNQLYSQRYGTIPIVRATGGLNDTVENFNEQTGSGSGFKFNDPTADALYHTVKWALSIYEKKPSQFKAMIKRVMELDLSWKKSAQSYENIYIRAIQKKQYEAQGYRSYYW